MSARPDISEELVHFTNGPTPADAFERLRAILASQKLVASGQHIRGGYRCVCFTEAPVRSLESGLVNLSSYSRYSAFGISVRKDWLFALGGRPVIYQPEAEFEVLPENLRWRHVRYEPGKIDFTWEREWRIRCDELTLDPANAMVVVPEESWARALESKHETAQDLTVRQYSMEVEEDLAEQLREAFPWRFRISGELNARA